MTDWYEYLPLLGVPLGMVACLYFIERPSWLECAIWALLAIFILEYIRVMVLRLLDPPFRLGCTICEVKIIKAPSEGISILHPIPTAIYFFQVNQQPQKFAQDIKSTFVHRGILIDQSQEGSFLGFSKLQTPPIRPEDVKEQAKEFRGQIETCPGLVVEPKLLSPFTTLMTETETIQSSNKALDQQPLQPTCVSQRRELRQQLPTKAQSPVKKIETSLSHAQSSPVLVKPIKNLVKSPNSLNKSIKIDTSSNNTINNHFSHNNPTTTPLLQNEKPEETSERDTQPMNLSISSFSAPLISPPSLIKTSHSNSELTLRSQQEEELKEKIRECIHLTLNLPLEEINRESIRAALDQHPKYMRQEEQNVPKMTRKEQIQLFLQDHNLHHVTPKKFWNIIRKIGFLSKLNHSKKKT